MARETKVGLLVGMAVILLIGIIVSDHLSAVKKTEPANMTTYADRVQRSYTDQIPAGPQSAQASMGDGRAPGTGIAPGSNTSVAGTQGGVPGGTIPRADEMTQPRVPQGQAVRPPGGSPGNASGPAVMPVGGGDQLPVAYHTQTMSGYAVPGESAGPAAGQPPQPGPTQDVLAYHTVRANETLSKISLLYYRDTAGWQLIQLANPQYLGRGGTGLREGIQLVIPRRAVSDAGPIYDPPSSVPQAQAPTSNDHQPFGPDTGGIFAPVTDPRRAPGASDGASLKVVEVQAKQTLSVLAEKYLGDKNRWREIYAANKDVLSSPEQPLKIGMKLKIPTTQADARPGTGVTAGSTTPGGATSITTPSNTPTTAKTYTVQSRDTLHSIAAKTLGDRNRWKDILALNKRTIESEDDLQVGQVLMLPASSGR